MILISFSIILKVHPIIPNFLTFETSSIKTYFIKLSRTRRKRLGGKLHLENRLKEFIFN
jgi:hypothetical protein